MERRVGECCQWKSIAQCSKGDSCSFSHYGAPGNRCGHRQKGQSSSPAPKAQTQTDAKQPSKGSGLRGECPSGTGGRIVCRNFLRRKCTNPSCNYWHLPVCLNHKSESGCKYGDKCRFRHAEVDGQPRTKSKKSCGKRISCLTEGVCTIGLCVSRIPSEKVYSTERGKIGIESLRQILQGHVAPHKKFGKRKGPSCVIQGCEPHECNPYAPRFEERTQDETLHQERCARRVAWDLAKNVCKLKHY